MRQALIAIATALCLLISPASYAGQGMGPGPGMTTAQTFFGFESGTLEGWATAGAFPFSANLNVVHSGAYAARSQTSGPGEGTLTRTVSTPAGATMTYWWTCGSGNVQLYIDGVMVNAIGLTAQWWSGSHVLSAGTHTIQFVSGNGYASPANIIIDDIDIH